MIEILRALGFDSEQEFHRMVAAADLSTPEKRRAFEQWQDDDGSKAGLLPLLAEAPDKNIERHSVWLMDYYGDI